MKTKITFAIISAFIWMMATPTIFAQCPAGQTSVTLEINAINFGTEISWQLLNTSTGTVVASQDCGAYATGDVVLEGPFCLNDGDTYTIIGYDVFGDGWNGSTIDVFISEDGSVNGCTTQANCQLIVIGDDEVDLEPDVASTTTCVGGTNIEYSVQIPTTACDASDIIAVGCTDPAGLNYNACATVDDGSCLIPAEGDDCNNPVPICGTTPVNSTNIVASTEPNDLLSTCIGSLENTVWFVFESDASGTPIDFTITENGCNGFALQTHIFSGVDCLGNGIEEDCTNTGPVYALSLATPTPNTTYYIYIDGNGGAECAFTIEGSGGIAQCCGAEFTLTPSCQAGDEGNYYVDIDVTDLGTDTEYTVTGGTNITATGTQTLGPFPNGTNTITVDAVNTDCLVENLVDFECACDSLAVTASEDIGPFCPDDAPFAITAVREEVIPGGFLGTYTVTTDAPGSCTATPDGAATPETLGDDNFVGPIALPFPFDFFGVTFNDFYIGSNGYITFGAGFTSLGNGPIPEDDGFGPNNLISLYWDDLDPGDSATGSITHYSATVNGQSCYVIEFNNIEHFPGGGAPTVTGQIILCPDGSVTINCIDCQTDNSGATQGIENADGTVGYFDPMFTDGQTDDALQNCVTFTPDVQIPGPCDFVGWVTDLNDIAGSTVSTDDSTSVSPTATTTYYAVVDCEGTLCVDDVVITLDDALCAAIDTVEIAIEDPCMCGNGIDLDGDGYNDILIETITITSGAAPYSVTLYSDDGTTGLVDMAGNAYSDTAIYPDAAAALEALITNNADGSATIEVYIPADGVSVYSIEVTDDNGTTASYTKPNGCPSCVPPDEVPTVGEWGLMILGLMMCIVAVVGIRQRRRESNLA